MPGFRALSSDVTGSVADSAREAEALQRDGDPETAVRLLEEALASSQRLNAEIPGWLCGRLAALYRTIGRHEDEVHLLERYRESQTSEEARSRYDARLSKARTIAERKRRSESGALVSVRKVLRSPRRRTPAPAPIVAHEIPRPLRDELTAAFAAADADVVGARLDDALRRLADDGRAAGASVEELVQTMREASMRASASGDLPEELRARRYSAALLRLLAFCFDEAPR